MYQFNYQIIQQQKSSYADIASQHQLAKSISKEISIFNNMSKCFIIFGIKDETTINKLLSDLKIDMNNANISNIVLNNGVL